MKRECLSRQISDDKKRASPENLQGWIERAVLQ